MIQLKNVEVGRTLNILYKGVQTTAIANYGMNAVESVYFMFKVWIKYRELDSSSWEHKKETTYISDRIKIEYAILNEPIEKALTLLSNSINNLNL